MYILDLKKDTLFINDEMLKKVHRPFFAKVSLPKSFEKKEALDEWLEDFEYEKGKSYLLYLLSRKDYFSWELRKKCFEKYLSKRSIDRCIVKLEDLNYLDDIALVQRFIEVHKYKKSPLQIKALFFKKQIPMSYFEKYYQIQEEEQKKMIRQWIEKKNLENQKLYLFLLRKGFSSALICQVMQEEF